jgi:hypothetical protein
VLSGIERQLRVFEVRLQVRQNKDGLDGRILDECFRRLEILAAELFGSLDGPVLRAVPEADELGPGAPG